MPVWFWLSVPRWTAELWLWPHQEYLYLWCHRPRVGQKWKRVFRANWSLERFWHIEMNCSLITNLTVMLHLHSCLNIDHWMTLKKMREQHLYCVCPAACYWVILLIEIFPWFMRLREEWEEAEAPRENPCRHGENMQIGTSSVYSLHILCLLVI